MCPAFVENVGVWFCCMDVDEETVVGRTTLHSAISPEIESMFETQPVREVAALLCEDVTVSEETCVVGGVPVVIFVGKGGRA